MLDKGAIFKNAVGTEFRLLAVTGTGSRQIAHVFNMDDPKALPRQWKLAELLEGLKDGEYEQLPTKRMPVLAMSSIDALQRPDASTAIGSERWKIIAPLVSIPEIYVRSKRGQLIKRRAEEFGCAENTVLTALRLYWRGGMTKDALRGAFANCGTPKDGAIIEGRLVRGRIPADERYAKFQWTAEVRESAIKTIKLLLRRHNKNSKIYIYRRVIAAHFTVVKPDGTKHPRPLGERPTMAQFKHLLKSVQTLEQSLRREHGDDNYENNVEPKTGSARVYAGGIAQYFEIDSTIPDVWICADSDRNVVIGKATLYLIIDAFSRLIVGFHLTLDKPSWASALESMMSLVEDKEILCTRWGVTYNSEDWVAHGVWPAMFRADRGTEFICHASDAISDHLETGLVNAPPRKSPRKGTVECSFKLVQVPLKESVGGYTPPSEFRERQTIDRKKLATRTLKSVGQELLEAVIKHNKKAHKGIELPPAQVYKRMQPIPNEIWTHEAANSAGALTRYDPDYLRFKLLPTEIFTVTPRGVSYKGLLWEPERQLRNHWLLPATNAHYKVKVTLDRRLVDVIYVHDAKDPSKWTTMRLTAQSVEFHGMSFAQYESVRLSRDVLNHEADEHNLRLEIEHDQTVISREAQARKATRAAIRRAGGRSRTKDGKAYREIQAEQQRVKTTTLQSTADLDTSPTPSPTTAIRNDSQQESKANTSQSLTVVESKSTPANAALQALLKMRKSK